MQRINSLIKDGRTRATWLGLFCALVLTMVFALLAWFIADHEQKTQEKRLAHYAELVARDVWVYNQEGVSKNLDIIAKAEGFLSLRILSMEGSLFAESTSQPAADFFDKALRFIGALRVTRIRSGPILYEGEPLGWLELYSESRNMLLYGLLFCAHLLSLVLMRLFIYRAQEKRHFEKHRESMQRELARSNRELEQYAFMVAHDLQAPITEMMHSLENLKATPLPSVKSPQEGLLTGMVDRLSRMRELVQGVLSYARLESTPLATRTLLLHEVIERAKGNLQSKIAATQASIISSELPRVTGNALQLEQVFQNLFSNALKFRSDRPPLIEVTAERDDEFWILSVRDNGQGISSENSARVFEFAQSFGRSSGEMGNGIGLAICKRIVERHGGRMWLESVEGEGTTFHLRLPGVGQRRQCAKIGAGMVVVVDDNSIVRTFWKSAIKNVPVEVFQSPTDFWLAFDKGIISKETICCVVTDYYFGTRDSRTGQQFAKELRARMAKPVFLCSDMPFSSTDMQESFDELLPKGPQGARRLIEILES